MYIKNKCKLEKFYRPTGFDSPKHQNMTQMQLYVPVLALCVMSYPI